MCKLLDDKELYDNISKNEKKYVETLSWKSTAKKINCLYENYIRKRFKELET